MSTQTTELKAHYPFYVAGEPREPNHDLPVLDKYSGEVATRVARADRAAVEDAIAAAAAAAEPMRWLKMHQRQAVLRHCVERFEQRQDELAEALCIEAGKPITDARGEVVRLIDTFRLTGEEVGRPAGELLPLDVSPRAGSYRGVSQRVPIGPCSFITPFNFPLNLVAHKVAPAIAAGCPFVLKPASDTPLGALILGEILGETDLPKGAWSVVTCSDEDAAPLVEDERIKLLSFTGSSEVGWQLKSRAGKKKVHLELGGNAAAVVDADTDLDDAVPRMIRGAFYQSGQSCISVQRILVHADVYESFRDKFEAAARDQKMGDPHEEQTFVGPLIRESAAERIEQWVDEAAQRGATVLCGSRREGVMYEPTVLENVPKDANVWREEVFGPVAVLAPFSDFDAALDEVNDSRFGLQAGVFTRDLYKVQRAWDKLEVGGVLINEVPAWRVDHMPYGGVKDSGLGREGPRYAIEEMTEPRLLVIRDPSV